MVSVFIPATARFNPCVSRNSSGAAAWAISGLKPLGFNPCVSRNSSGAVFNEALDVFVTEVSIRVLVGIAQELTACIPRS